jgi:hypothetical protein
MASYGMINVPSFVKIGTGVQAVSMIGLKFSEAVMLLLLMVGCKDIETKFNKVWLRHPQLIGGLPIQTRRQKGDFRNLILLFQKQKIRLKIDLK